MELPGGATMEMVWVEPGTFTMGTTEEQESAMRSKEVWSDWSENEQPAHEVRTSRGFYLGKYEITQDFLLAPIASCGVAASATTLLIPRVRQFATTTCRTAAMMSSVHAC